jgi:uncharacterized coiled-coil protein SlyX
MLLAEGDVGGWLAVGTVVGALLTAAAGAAVKLLSERRRIAKDARLDAIAEWRELAARLEAQHERCEAVISQQQQALDALRAIYTGCREDCVETRSNLRHLYECVRRMHARLKAAGQDPGELPEMPPERERSSAEAEFLARQAAQSAGLLKAADKAIVPPTK